MLTIRKSQMAVFEAHFSRRFREELRLHLRTEFPSQLGTADDATLNRLINDGITRGRTYGITSERDLTLFVDLLVLLGLEFDRNRKLAWARRILADETLDGEAKMQAIYQRLAAFEQAGTAPASA